MNDSSLRLGAALALPAALVAVGMLGFRNVELTFLLYTLGGCVAGPRLILGARPPELALPFLPPRGHRRAVVRRALLLWLLYGPALFIVYALARPHLDNPHHYVAALEARGWHRSRIPLYTILFLALVPWCEERWWRGEALPRAVARFGPRAGLVIAGLAFASYHLVVLAPLVPPASLAVRIASITGGGLVWSIAALRDRAWGGCWFSHLFGADLVIVAIFAMFST
jgi:membrane protease YdiL (CAAX protease family)